MYDILQYGSDGSVMFKQNKSTHCCLFFSYVLNFILRNKISLKAIQYSHGKGNVMHHIGGMEKSGG